MIYLCILANIFWSASYTFMKWGTEFAAPIHVVYFRMTLALILLALLNLKTFKPLPFRVVLRCAFLGGLIAFAHAMGVIGIDRSYATDGVLLYALEPVIAIMWARIILKERMDTARKAALFLALLGFAVLSNVFAGGFFANSTFVGNFIMFAGIFADGLFSPIAKPVVEGHSSRLILFVSLIFTVIFLTPFAVTTPIRPTTFSWQLYVSVFYLAAICSVFGWTLWLKLLKSYKVNVIVLSVFIQPVVGPFISHFTLGEQISARVWFGGAIILCAVALSLFKRKQSESELIAEAVIH